MFKNIKQEEKISFLTHFAGVIASIGGTIFLLIKAETTTMRLMMLIYGFSITFLFSASSLYHAFKQKENENSTWRKLDHLAIFFMIAGSYTPICYYHLDGAWFYSILSCQWGLVIFGIFFKFFFLKAPRVLYTSIYLLMGWMAIIPIKKLITSMSTIEWVLLFSGALSFTVGAVIYAIKKPVIKKGFFGFHEIFHIFILLGGILHFFMVYIGMKNFSI